MPNVTDLDKSGRFAIDLVEGFSAFLQEYRVIGLDIAKRGGVLHGQEISCRDAGYDCGFMIRSESEDELIGFVQEHAKETHDAEMSIADVRGVWKTV